MSLLCFLFFMNAATALAEDHASQPAAEHGQPVSVTLHPSAETKAANSISVADYRVRLQVLDRLIVRCQSAMTPVNCPSDQVGPDVQLVLPAGSRAIRFAWLRLLLDAAAKSQEEGKREAAEQAKAVKDGNASLRKKPDFEPPTLSQQLQQARDRLAQDSATASSLANASTFPSQNPPAGKSAPRQVLARILEDKEFQPAVARRSPFAWLQEKAANWIDDFFGKLEQAGFHSRWVGATAEVLFVLALCIGLVWFLIRLERQGRLNLALIRPGPGSAASARDWQLWLEDARRAAARGAWRDAIHLLYWASISRLESSGRWPADRARTPREYLALLTTESASFADLADLTRSFERTWYAGRPAAAADFRHAEQIAAKLGVEARASGPAQEQTADWTAAS